MSPQQELDWNNWEKKYNAKGQDDIVKKWHSIYKSLVGEGLFPSPCKSCLYYENICFSQDLLIG
jgi:hypothetical protein